MRLRGGLLIAFMIFIALFSEAHGIEIGGGISAVVGASSSAQGNSVSDNKGAASIMTAVGSIPYAGVNRYVEDKNGKRADISYNVT